MPIANTVPYGAIVSRAFLADLITQPDPPTIFEVCGHMGFLTDVSLVGAELTDKELITCFGESKIKAHSSLADRNVGGLNGYNRNFWFFYKEDAEMFIQISKTDPAEVAYAQFKQAQVNLFDFWLDSLDD